MERTTTTRTIFAAMLLVLGADVALADSFTVTQITIKDPADNDNSLQESELKEFFNHARCVCKSSVKVRFEVNIDRQGESRAITAVCREGSCVDADDGDINEVRCEKLALTAATMDDVSNTQFEETYTADQLMHDADCNEPGDVEIQLAVYAKQEGNFAQLESAVATYDRDVDPPKIPQRSSDASKREPRGGEGRVTVTFVNADNNDDTKYYQVFCTKIEAGSQSPWGGTAKSAAFLTAQRLCQTDAPLPAQTDAGDTADAGTADAGTVDAAGASADDATSQPAASGAEPTQPARLLSDDAYICSERLTTDGAHTIEGLEIGTNYGFYVVAIDDSQNPSEPLWLGTGTPAPVEDLWEIYGRLGGKGEGGYGCALAPAVSWAPGLLGLLALVVFGWRRARRRQRTGAVRKGSLR